MRPLREARLVPYGVCSCFENMAVDEYLISYYKKTGKPVLRLYSWDPPAISIGKYQKAEDVIDTEICKRNSVDIVRRITGGGAIFHEHELTYTVVCSERDIGVKNLSVKDSYERLNSFIIEMYKSFELKASFAKDSIDNKKTGEHTSFCFSGNEEYDIIISKKKIGGNAQFRSRDIIFQHGSIPLSIDKEKIKEYFKDEIDFQNFTCFNELLSREIEPEEVAKKLISSFERVFNCELKVEGISGSEKGVVDGLM